MKPAPIDPPPIHDAQWAGISGQVAWDIGANAGQTIEHLITCFDEVVAFEPAAECREWLDKWRDHPKVTVVECAVTNSDGDIQLAVLPDQIDTGQLVTPGTHGMEWSGALPAAQARTVPGYRLDTLVSTYRTPDFIKVDVEGHELWVLQGGLSLLGTGHPTLLIEFHAPELYDACSALLFGLGYDLTVIRHPWYEENSRMWHQHGWIRAVYPADR